MPVISPRARLLSATAIACGTLSIGATAARADCQPDPPNGAPVVTCKGTDDNGFAAPPADDLTVEVTGNINKPIPGNPNGAAISFDDNSANKALDNAGSINGYVTAIGNSGNVTIFQRGSLNGGVTITGTGTNTLVAEKTINNRVSLEGASNTVDLSSNLNKGLELTGSEFNHVVIRSGGGHVNDVFTVTGDGSNWVDNYGKINADATIDGDGTSVFINRSSGAVNGNLQSLGASEASSTTPASSTRG